ncbi:MAG: ATP-binding protein [Pseudomonadota bacterium]|nr:ATP-binding protein [Pseudomonadota bacterium]
MAVQAFENGDRKVLVLPPTRRDGDVTCAMLRNVGLDCDVVRNARMLASQLSTSIGAIVLTDAVVGDPELSSVMDALDHQPQWSDVPVILLSRPAAHSHDDKRRFGKLTNVTVLDRPTSGRALVSAVEAAIRGRARQYQIRDQLNSLQAADTALRESAERMSLGVQVAGLALAEVDYATQEVHLSAEAARLFGVGDRARVMPRAEFLAAVHPDDRVDVARRLFHSADSVCNEPPAIDYRVVWPDGRVKWVSQRHQVVLNGLLNQQVRAMIVALDATERKNADRRKDEFLATLAHELRNPLAPIRTGLQALSRPGGEGAAGPIIRAIMERQLSQMVRLIDDLLDVSRISSGKVVLQRTRVDLRAIAELAIEASQPFIAAGQHDFKAELPEGPLWVDGDASRLSQVIINLLNNAAKYTAEGGQVRLSLSSDDTDAVVRVQDNGVGIPAEMLDEVFDMFTQVNRTLDRSQGGLGIGLSLVRRLTEMHGGEVAADSKGLGHGSIFTVRLPLMAAAESPAARDEAAEREPPQRPRLRILVVDDIADVADVLKMLLDLEGFETRVAYSGPTALECAREYRPDVVICDIGLPAMDGHEIARRLRSDPKVASATLIALTGWGAEGEVRRTRESGFDFHLVKPVDASALLELLSQISPRAQETRPTEEPAAAPPALRSDT